MKKLNPSEYRLRKAIGILGFLLPILVFVGHGELLSSISHYYYSSSSVFFIGILIAFGLVLLTYRGYPKDNHERLSDDVITTFAAICIFITVLIPTSSDNTIGTIHYDGDYNYLFGHANHKYNTIHLISAGLFLIALGFMSFAKFTLGNNIPKSRKTLYKICGITIWGSILTLLILILIDKHFFNGKLEEKLPAYVYWMEVVAVWAFAIAWLVKGKFNRDIQQLFNKQA